MPGLERRADQLVPRIVQRGRAGIGHEGNIAVLQSSQDRIQAREFVVLIVAEDGSVNVVMGEELACDPRIFGGNQVHLAQSPQGTGRHILEIADGGGDEVKRAHAIIVSSRFAAASERRAQKNQAPAGA